MGSWGSAASRPEELHVIVGVAVSNAGTVRTSPEQRSRSISRLDWVSEMTIKLRLAAGALQKVGEAMPVFTGGAFDDRAPWLQGWPPPPPPAGFHRAGPDLDGQPRGFMEFGFAEDLANR